MSRWITISFCLFFVISAPLTLKAAGPEPILVNDDLERAQLWYLGWMDKSKADARLGRYMPKEELSENLEALRHFQYVLSDSFSMMMQDNSVQLAFLVQPEGRYWTFPENHTLVINRDEDTWSVDRIFVVYFWENGNYLEPRFQNLGGENDVHLQLNPGLDLAEFEKLGWRIFHGNLYDPREETDKITVFILMSSKSNLGKQWDSKDRKPFTVLAVSTEPKEARHEETDRLNPDPDPVVSAAHARRDQDQNRR